VVRGLTGPDDREARRGALRGSFRFASLREGKEMARAPTEELTGSVAAITWRSADGAFLVALLADGTTVAGQTVAGPTLGPGAEYRFHGRWQQHPRHGRQFAADAWFPVQPHDERGIITYLETFAEGVGTRRALKLWEAFGPDAVRVLQNQPEIVAARGVMTRKAAIAAANSLWAAGAFQDTKIALMGLLAGRGFQLAVVMREAIRLWTVQAPLIIRRSPYALMLRRVPSCGFQRCDKLYLDLGNRPDRLKRQALCLWHWLRTDGEGHTWHSCQRTEQVLNSLIGADAEPLRAMRMGKRAGIFVVRHDGGDWIADRRNADNEQRLAEHVKGLLTWTPQRRDSAGHSRITFDGVTLDDGL
jgi:exodeoxyribonuclease V alpha subunit